MMASNCEGYYAIIAKSAPTVVHKHFHIWVSEEELLVSALKCLNPVTGNVEAVPVLIEEAALLSNAMNVFVKAYEYKDRQIFYTDILFTNDEFMGFKIAYQDLMVEGIKPRLCHREFFDISTYVEGLINLSLVTKIAVNGCLEINFGDLSPECIPYLHNAKMIYTRPMPGYFTRVEVNEQLQTIAFYI